MVDYRASALITAIATGALIPAAMLPILARTVRRYGRLRGWPMLAGVGLLGAAIALAAYTVLPLPDAADLRCVGGLTSSWITDPRVSTAPILDALQVRGPRALLGDAHFLQFFLNVLLFAPFGFFLHQVTRWNVAAVLASGFLLSLGIEGTQGTAFLGIYPCPYRTFDVADLIANTGGATGGAILSAILVAAVPSVSPRPVADLDAPTVGRRAVATLIDAGLVAVAGGGAVGAVAVYRGLEHGRAAAVAVVEDRGDWGLALLAASALVGLIHPLLRRDRATPGQAVVNVGPGRDGEDGRHAALWQLVVRWAVRWAPLSLVPLAPVILAVVAVVELACLALTRDRSSLAGASARTTTRTLPSFAARRADLVGARR